MPLRSSPFVLLARLGSFGAVAVAASLAFAAPPTPTPSPSPAATASPKAPMVMQNAGVKPGGLAPAQREALSAINRYFNSVRTMSGAFVQFGPDGETADGEFHMARPGKIRFIYAKPSNLDIVADGIDVVVRDIKNQTKDLYPLGKTPLRFLLADQIDLTSEANVTKVSLEPDLISVVLEQNTVFGDGKLTMVFDRKSSELRQWTVTDAQGYDTTVAVYNVTPNQPVDEKLFKIDRTIIR
ncbi:outer membrane lipoprotein carrier protein LolA [Siculibacillus lacustris]|uniref:Outer membrane lipoprotein carrier protein LolA n=1 Tax=Siculibacillus lacustris TaxID=1549641 RepID=A0A4Q9VNE0_9HYPH|nr:outer-membrane lipoprotein carrier protein LolA [Siculibacillus lacustris]TBW36299.1 outer membrane lipoprotein carrier protein LolA [Siculibacillus lacustris]